MEELKKIVEGEFFRFLKHYINMFGHDSFTNLVELNKVGKKLFKKRFKGVYTPVDIKKIYNKRHGIGSMYILNDLDFPGRHWTALAKISDNTYLFYDSFGRSFEKMFRDKATDEMKRITINTEKDQEQKINEELCGQACLAFLTVYYYYGPQAAYFV